MSKLADVIAYLCAHYPHKHELSKARLTKLVYLADWMSAQKHDRQITAINWYFHNYGPYVDDVIEEARHDPRIQIHETTTIYGAPKILLSINTAERLHCSLSSDEMAILDKVINDTKPLFWDAFIRHVYSTYPIRVSDRYQVLDLLKMAQEEKGSTVDPLSM